MLDAPCSQSNESIQVLPVRNSLPVHKIHKTSFDRLAMAETETFRY